MRKTALILIDIQQAFIGEDAHYWGAARNNPDAEKNMLKILQHWRALEQPVIHIRHCSIQENSPLRLECAGNAFQTGFEPVPGELELTKTVNSAYIGTGLCEHLKNHDIQDVIHIGLTTDHCVSTSTRMAGNLGFSVTLITDATATFDRTDHQGQHISADEMHRINLASLNGEFATLKTTAELLDAH